MNFTVAPKVRRITFATLFLAGALPAFADTPNITDVRLECKKAEDLAGAVRTQIAAVNAAGLKVVAISGPGPRATTAHLTNEAAPQICVLLSLEVK